MEIRDSSLSLVFFILYIGKMKMPAQHQPFPSLGKIGKFFFLGMGVLTDIIIYSFSKVKTYLCICEI